MIKKLYYFIAILISFISTQSLSQNNDQVRIIMKINEKIITNVDVKKEYEYLKALNNNLAALPINEGYKIAQDSLIREIIKTDELNKFKALENFNEKNLIDNVLNNIAKTLKMNNELELENYLNTYGISLNDLRNKMIIEILWNQLIVSRYKDKVKVDIEKIRKQIENEGFLEKENKIQYELSEILFQAKSQSELNDLTKLIEEDIARIGFKNTANKFSVAETAKLGGYLGILNETQLSNQIRELLSSLEVGDYTGPIKVGSNFLILHIDNKKIVKETVDEEALLTNLIKNERQRQFDNFSQIYFNKLKINSFIDEY